MPAGANPSKLGTWVQRVALDRAALAEVPDEHRATVEAAADLLADPATCLAIPMEGDVGERMRSRLGAGPGDHAYLLLGMRAET